MTGPIPRGATGTEAPCRFRWVGPGDTGFLVPRLQIPGGVGHGDVASVLRFQPGENDHVPLARQAMVPVESGPVAVEHLRGFMIEEDHVVAHFFEPVEIGTDQIIAAPPRLPPAGEEVGADKGFARRQAHGLRCRRKGDGNDQERGEKETNHGGMMAWVVVSFKDRKEAGCPGAGS